MIVEPSTDRLLQRSQRGDARAWEQIVHRYKGLVFTAAKRVGLNDDDANDVFQATFLALHRHLDRIEQAETLPKWLAVTASREALRVKRIRTKHQGVDLGEDRSLDDLVAFEEASAEASAIRLEQGLHLREAIAELPGRCQDLLTLLYLEEDFSYAEISEKLGMPMGAIGPTRARCLEKLRSRLEKGGFFE